MLYQILTIINFQDDLITALLAGGVVVPPTIFATIAVMKSQLKQLRIDQEEVSEKLDKIREAQESERLEVHERLVKLETLIIKNGNGKH